MVEGSIYFFFLKENLARDLRLCLAGGTPASICNIFATYLLNAEGDVSSHRRSPVMISTDCWRCWISAIRPRSAPRRRPIPQEKILRPSRRTLYFARMQTAARSSPASQGPGTQTRRDLSNLSSNRRQARRWLLGKKKERNHFRIMPISREF